MKKYQALLKRTVCASLLCSTIPAAHANNWFDLQTVAFPSWGSGRFIGFIQPVFTNISASPAANHLIPRPDYVGETDSTGTGSTSSAYLQRARFLVRGLINPDISYYIGAEAGDNAYTYSFGNYAPRIIDANLTFSNMLPLGNRFEVGVIRAPGPEDAMQGFMVFNFLDLFTSATAQLSSRCSTRPTCTTPVLARQVVTRCRPTTCPATTASVTLACSWKTGSWSHRKPKLPTA